MTEAEDGRERKEVLKVKAIKCCPAEWDSTLVCPMQSCYIIVRKSLKNMPS